MTSSESVNNNEITAGAISAVCGNAKGGGKENEVYFLGNSSIYPSQGVTASDK